MNILLDAGAHPVIGHRGARAHAPENTIESFAQAVAAGAEAIEFDIRLSADGVPVVFHDPQVSRTTDGTGEVKRMTFAELRELDAGARYTPDGGKTYPYAGMGHRIPSLEEVIEAFPSTPVLIE
ncbi:MAG TPA: glycerophosphodiester phosphodiesterase family protein, partial [Gemmatimonadaceae bacterium]|nr:glycerophosphodiester phosphodiesterase family protein [Gemmatimonadaceae bacterium]